MNFRRAFIVSGSIALAAVAAASVESFYFVPNETERARLRPVMAGRVPASRSEPALLGATPLPGVALETQATPGSETAGDREEQPEPVAAEPAAGEPLIESPAPLPPPPLPAPAGATAQSPRAEENPAPALPVAPAPSPRKRNKKIWIWAGARVSQHRLKESLTGGTDSSFRSAQWPGLYFRAGFSVDKGGLDFSYEKMPGKVSSPPTAEVEGGTYYWSVLRAHAFWRPSKEWRIKGGISQDHSPLLYPDFSSGKIYLRSLSVLGGSLGLEWSPQVSSRGRLELGATYQRPLSASTLDRATVDLEPKPGGQISVGYAHSVGNSLRLGAYLQFDRQDYSFSYRDTPSAATSQGRQTLSSQSLGLRLGWEY